jgi:glycosyltransferase involved in cell wall biosynthesis
VVPTFLFFGTLAGLGSRSAMRLLANRIYAQMLARWKPRGFRILIAGRGELPKWFADRIADKPEFEWLGFVPDIDSVIASSHAVLFPIDVAVGNRSRILTALCKGALVIAHRNVALGNPALVDGQTCALAVTPKEFIDRMVRSVEDEHWARAVAEQGRRCYEELFSPKRAASRLICRLRG